MKNSGIFEAVLLAGSQSALARKLKIRPQAVQQWLDKGYVPVSRCNRISEMYGIPTERLVNPALLKLIVPDKRLTKVLSRLRKKGQDHG